MAKIDPALLQTINEFHLTGECCGVKSEVTLTDLKATVKACPVCGYMPGPNYKALAECALDAIRGGPDAPDADGLTPEAYQRWILTEWDPWVNRLASALTNWRKAHEPSSPSDGGSGQ